MSLSEITGRVPSWKAKSNSSQWESMKYLLWILSYLMTREMNPVPLTISLTIMSNSRLNSDNGQLTTQTNSLHKLLCLINRLIITTWASLRFLHWCPVLNKYFSKMEYSSHLEHFRCWTYLKMDSSIEH